MFKQFLIVADNPVEKSYHGFEVIDADNFIDALGRSEISELDKMRFSVYELSTPHYNVYDFFNKTVAENPYEVFCNGVYDTGSGWHYL